MRIEPVEFPDAGGAIEPSEHPLTQAYLHSAPRPDVPWSRWSYAPGPATLSLRCDGITHVTVLRSESLVLRQWANPLDALNWLGSQTSAAPSNRPTEAPPFCGGWIGWFSYELGRLFESVPERARNDLRLPLFEFTFHPGGLAVDLHAHKAYRFVSAVEREFERPIRATVHRVGETARFQSNFTRSHYENTVARVIDYIRAGDIFQVNLSQRFTGAAEISAPQIYRRLWNRTPAWFGAYYSAPDYALVSDSPELFFRVTRDDALGRRRIITRPIKGTRPRAAGMDFELRNSLKDQAELNMIVDLERNDLGRICQIGTVKVTQPREIEEHPTVYHGAATVEGTLRPEISLVDLLRAIFPGGSITGAPKIRAMQIIEELEPVRRGPYCGAIGYLSTDGTLQFNLAIRTMVIKDGRIHIPVGGGIVADSDPENEFDETLVKARAMFAALGISENEIA